MWRTNSHIRQAKAGIFLQTHFLGVLSNSCCSCLLTFGLMLEHELSPDFKEAAFGEGVFTSLLKKKFNIMNIIASKINNAIFYR